MATRRMTSGVLPVPTGSPQRQTAVHLLLSSFLERDSETPFQVNRIAEDGTKLQIRSGVLSVAAGGAARLVLDDVAGERIEVNLQLPAGRLEPSIAFVTTARASNTSDVTEWVSPRDFAALPALNDEPGEEEPVRRVTTGIIAVDAAGNDSAPPFIYEVLLMLSNFSGTEQRAAYVLNRLQASLGAKSEVERGELTIAPGTVGQVTFSRVSGDDIEINVDIARHALIPSLAVLRRGAAERSVDPVLRLGPRGFVLVPGTGPEGGQTAQ